MYHLRKTAEIEMSHAEMDAAEKYGYWWILQMVGVMIKLCTYVILSLRHPEGSQCLPDCRSAPAADILKDVWWTVSCNYTILFLSPDVKNTIYIQYLSMVLTLLNMSDSRFRKLIMLWMWRHHGMALWCHGSGAWHNYIFLMTGININCWAVFANHMTRRC